MGSFKNVSCGEETVKLPREQPVSFGLNLCFNFENGQGQRSDCLREIGNMTESKSKDPADWKEWKKTYQNTIRHSQFEWNFAIEVIPNVKGLKPSQVIPQHPFIGRDGREYHMDFAIITERVKIAIELEGYDKTNTGKGKTRKEHDDFSRRIQDLTRLGWKVLTITKWAMQTKSANLCPNPSQKLWLLLIKTTQKSLIQSRTYPVWFANWRPALKRTRQ
jgi:hypothetical protein